MASRYSRLTFQILRIGAVTYLLIVLLMTFIESWLVYPSPPKSWGDWAATDFPHEDVQIASTDGVKLHGWLFNRSSPQHLIVYFHGNGEHVALNAKRMNELSDQLSAAVLIFDYRGYGKSEGSPTESGVIADGKAAHKWMAKRYDVDPDEIVLMGRSLGGGVAVAVAAEQGAKALVLQNTFASMVDTAAGLYPLLPVKLVMRNRYESGKRIANYNGPLLQSHGTEDRIVPFEQGLLLFAASPSKNKQFIEFPGGGHNDLEPMSYMPKLKQFLDSLD